MGYLILGIITFILLVYFIYDTVRHNYKKEHKKMSDDEIRQVYEGDVDKDESPNNRIRTVESLMATEFAEEILNTDKKILSNEDEDDDERDELKE